MKDWTASAFRSARPVTCPGGDYNVVTSWGFLSLRLPEEDDNWLNDKVTILKAIGVLDAEGPL